MAKAENKTKPTDVAPADSIAAIEHDRRRADAETLLGFFNGITKLKPKMWGPSIIGYGRYAYKYDSGREGESLLTGFSPRKSNLSLYVMPGYSSDEMQDRLAKLGKHKLGKSCLYINKLADIDMAVLEDIIKAGLDDMYARYETWDE